MPQPPEKLRKQYENTEFPNVILRFEDGHEIELPKGSRKGFDVWAGERVKILAVWDASAGEREKVDTWRAEQFQDEQV
jgi:hypothetical protein